jgi:hypothetical protein
MVMFDLLLNWLPSAEDVAPFLDKFLLLFMRPRSMNIDKSIPNYILVLNQLWICNYLL